MPLRLPGDYLFKSLVISNDDRAVDVSSVMLGLEIYEDMYSPGMTGSLHIVDGIDLYEIMPLLGGEKLTVNFSTDLDGTALHKDFTFQKEFIITGIKDIKQGTSESNKTYTLDFVSPIFFKNHEVKLSRLYNAPISTMVEDIFTNALMQDETLEIERTKYSEEFLVPSWTPLRTIEYLSRSAIPSTGNDASYMFFETKDGFTFASLSYLFKKESTRTLSMPNAWNGGAITGNNPHVITKLDINTTPDLLDGISAGMYGGTLNTVDLINKKLAKRTYEYDVDFASGVKHLNKDPLAAYSPNQEHFRHYYSSGNAISSNSNEWRLARISRINQINSFVVTVKCPNFTKQKIGDVVTLDIKSSRKMIEVQGEEIKDKTLSGKYLVRAIRHIVAQGGYDIIMELVKDSKIK